MKTTKQYIGKLVVGGSLACCLSLFTSHTLAIEGLHISVQSSNVVLSWPSTNTETYIVQYRSNLVAGSWLTLTDYFPAAANTNVTFFVHSNVIQQPNGSSGSFAMASSAGSGLSMALAVPESATPMAMPADGSGSAVPLFLYPPGFDLSRLIILDPLSGEWINGSAYSARPLSLEAAQCDMTQPLGGDSPSPDGDGGAGPTPETGFYRVARDGMHIYGLTNGAVLSGSMQFPIEFALGSTDEIVGVAFYDENNSPIIGASAQGTGN
jgi:hypothetical protein